MRISNNTAAAESIYLYFYNISIKIIFTNNYYNAFNGKHRVRVEFYNSENTIKEQLQMYFIKDHNVSLYIRSIKLVLKTLACMLYVIRVILDKGPLVANW